jgi:hypothetical protein
MKDYDYDSIVGLKKPKYNEVIRGVAYETGKDFGTKINNQVIIPILKFMVQDVMKTVRDVYYLLGLIIGVIAPNKTEVVKEDYIEVDPRD